MATSETQTEAPYGYKADGTARKRPVPHAAIAARRNGHEPAAKPAAKKAAKPAAKRRPAISRPEARSLAESPTLDRVAREIEQEINRLQAALDAVKGAARP